MSDEIVTNAQQVIGRAPEWVRQDLVSSDQAARVRAEETLAARIAAALQERQADLSSAN